MTVAAQAGRFLRLDTRRADGPFAAFLARSGLAVFDTLTTMSLGRSWPVPEGPVTYAPASRALSEPGPASPSGYMRSN